MEQLYIKPDKPNKQEDVNIKFDVPKEGKGEPKQTAKIVDHTHRNLIDRTNVLKKINPFLVKHNKPVLQAKLVDKPIDKLVDKPIDKLVESVVTAPEETVLQLEPVIEKEPIENEPKDLPMGEPVIQAAKPKLKLTIRKPKGKAPIQEPAPDLTAAALSLKDVIANLPKHKQSIQIRAPSYYLNNRKLYIQKIADLFKDYRSEMVSKNDTVSCDTLTAAGADFDLLTHQKIVRDYLSLYTPYRGLLLYHGLGGGKSCTSIAIAEGMKSDKKIYLMTPASLKSNYFNEIKKCGDELYKKNQHWHFVSVEGNPTYTPILAKALSVREAGIKKAGGAWVVDISKPKNFGALTPKQQNDIDTQLNEMIRSKYHDINYNGLNMRIVAQLTNNNTVNPFDNAVVVIDEAHNFVSRIVNKLKDKKSISYMLYDLLMRANNARVVLLSGTPIINYPKEIAILFNILRGYIRTWSMQVSVGPNGGEISKDKILELLHENKFATHDYVEYTGNVLTITRNPFGFVNVEKRGVAQGTKRAPAKPMYAGDKRKTKKLETPHRKTKKSENRNRKTRKITILEEDAIIDNISEPMQMDVTETVTTTTTPESISVMTSITSVIEPKSASPASASPASASPASASPASASSASASDTIATKISIENQPESFQNVEEYTKERDDPEHIDNNPYLGGENVINPYMMGGVGEFSKYNGVRLDEMGNISDEEFLKRVVLILKQKYNVSDSSIKLKYNKSLPDDSEKIDENKFTNTFLNLETGEFKNVELFQRRILGLTSYFRSAQEGLLPNFVLTEDKQVYHIEKTVMSVHQFTIYAKIRKEEADSEKRNRQKKAVVEDDLFKVSSTYRIFSRAACNFVFPDGIERPVPDKGKVVDEMTMDVVPKEARQLENSYLGFGEDKEAHPEEEEEKAQEDVGAAEVGAAEDAAAEESGDDAYLRRIEKAMEDVDAKQEGTNDSIYLNETALMDLSPKFLNVLKNIKDENNKGLHLLYSHFRTIEGIGIIRLILLANGFAEFKLKKTATVKPLPIETDAARLAEEETPIEEMERYQWDIEEDEDPLNRDKPKFVLYTGTESFEEREIILNIYNGKWEYVPKNIRKKLEADQTEKKNANKNMYGDVIKAIMITSSGAEGINLTNTRFVHIVEPYWHMVRIDQVVGRARRICSHKDLPQDMQTVQVFLYVTTLSEEQRTDDGNIELRLRDVSRIDGQTPITTDESLYETASLKQRINNQILYAVKQTAMDCKLYSGISKTDDEPIVCYNFGEITSNNFGSIPEFDQDADVKEDLNVAKVKTTIKKITIGDKQYAYNPTNKDVYDLESFERARKTGTEPIVVGKLIQKDGKYELVK